MSNRVVPLLLAATGGRWRRSGTGGPRSQKVGSGSNGPPRAGRRVLVQDSGR